MSKKSSDILSSIQNEINIFWGNMVHEFESVSKDINQKLNIISNNNNNNNDSNKKSLTLNVKIHHKSEYSMQTLSPTPAISEIYTINSNIILKPFVKIYFFLYYNIALLY